MKRFCIRLRIELYDRVKLLAKHYNIDKTLGLDSFMTAYFEAVNQEATIEEETI